MALPLLCLVPCFGRGILLLLLLTEGDDEEEEDDEVDDMSSHISSAS